MTRLAATLLFAVILAGLVTLIYLTMAPQPIYKRPTQHPDQPHFDLPTGATLTYRFDAPGARITGFWFQHLFTDREARVLLHIENETKGTTLLREHIGYGYRHHASFGPGNDEGDRIAVHYRVEQSQKDRFPGIRQLVKIANKRPRIPIEATLDGKPLDPATFWPLFQIRYAQPIGNLRLLWPVAGAIFTVIFIAGPTRGKRLTYYLLLGSVLTATSAPLWAHRYENDWGHSDPDRYGRYASHLAQWPWTRSPSERADLKQAYRDHIHAFVAFVPFCVALLMQLHIPMWAAYLFLVGLASFLILILVDWFLAERLALSPRTVLAAVTLLGCHAVFVKAFVKVSSDQIGVLLPLAACMVLTLRLDRRFTEVQELAWGALLLALALCRPPGLAYLAFFVAATILVDALREKSWNPLHQLPSMEFYLAPPVVLYALMFFGFDWAHNLAATREKSAIFYDQAILPFCIKCMITTAHILPFVALGFRRNDLQNRHLWIIAAWGVAYLALIAIVKAPFVVRLFLPVVPIVYILAAVALDRFTRRRSAYVLALTLGLASLNVSVMIWSTGLQEGPPLFLRRFLFY